MSALTKYLVYGPNATLRRMAPKLYETIEPKFLYNYQSSANSDEVSVAVFEEYEKQINATVTLVCVIESSDKKTRVELKKSGGRMGFRGSSLSEDKNIESNVIDFIVDYTKRYGLSLQEIIPEEAKEESDVDIDDDDEDDSDSDS